MGMRKGVIRDKGWEGELRSDFEYPEAGHYLGFYVVGTGSQ